MTNPTDTAPDMVEVTQGGREDNCAYSLENCPFCQGEFPPTVTRTKEGDVVICISCSALGPTRRTITEAIDAWNTRAQSEAPLRAEVERLSDLLDQERYKVAAGVQTIARAVQGRKWLSEPGRGSYTYDDERYQAEFGAALDEIDAALAPLRKIASDWSDCPRDPLRVAANRAAALNPKDTDNG